MALLHAAGLEPKRTSVQAPWQNGIAERWIVSCRREILDHVIPLNEEHLRRIIRDYVTYHEADRLHDSLEKDTHRTDVP
jgi:putative transposase